MLKIILVTSISDGSELYYENGVARIVGSKLVVEDGSKCVLVTEFKNVRELVYRS